MGLVREMWDPWIFQGESAWLVTYDSGNGLKWSRPVRMLIVSVVDFWNPTCRRISIPFKQSTRISDDTGNLKQRRYLFVSIKDILLVFMRRFLGDKILFETLR